MRSLFSNAKLADYLKISEHNLGIHVHKITYNLTLEDNVQEQLYQKLCVRPLILYWDKVEKFPELSLTDLIEIGILIPFDRDKELFKLCPSNSTDNPPNGSMLNDGLRIILKINSKKINVEEIFNKEKKLIDKYVEWVNHDINKYNRTLKIYHIPRELEKLQSRQADLKNAQQQITNMGIPVRKVKKNNDENIKIY